MKKDIFDRIMGWKIFKPVYPLYIKYKEALLYLFFGVLTTLLNMGCFAVCTECAGWDPLFSNVIAWIVGVIFAYVTNRTWVFSSNVSDAVGIVKECLSFSAGRLATLGMEELILWDGIKILHINTMLVKLVAQVLVVVGNYIISKLFVFKKKA